MHRAQRCREFRPVRERRVVDQVVPGGLTGVVVDLPVLAIGRCRCDESIGVTLLSGPGENPDDIGPFLRGERDVACVADVVDERRYEHR